MNITGILQLVNTIFLLGFLGIGIYILVLTIKLMKKGIKALDNYNKNF